MQLHHQRNQIQVATFSPQNQTFEIAGFVNYVGVGQQKIIGMKGCSGLQALGNGPELPGPSGGQRSGCKDSEMIPAAHSFSCLAGNLRSAVGALIVNQENVGGAETILQQQGANGRSD